MNNDDSFVNMGELPGHEQSQRIAYLVAGYLEDNLSIDEQKELDEWLKESNGNQRIFADLTDLQKLERQLRFTDQVSSKATWGRISNNINKPVAGTRPLWQYVTAACVIFLAGFVIVQIVNLNFLKNEKPVAFVPTPGLVNPGDINPGHNRATLKIGNSEIILLTDSVSETIANGITNVDGQLIYQVQAKKDVIEWHELQTPRGGSFMLTLPDQSKVWLNSASSIRFPSAFTGKERRVELIGEAYFEVTHQAQKPFIVTLPKNRKVTVLGTKFNVNAYEDEPALKTTLLDGSVRVSAGSDSRQAVLSPGQQAKISHDGKLSILNLKNPAIEAAWHYGEFEFADADIETVMRSVSRWYDAEIIYKSKPTDHFYASIGRDVPVSKLLQILQATGEVSFEIQDKKIYVNP